ncbi:M16 family metallopeptidase [Glacieibacterium frigidum]|uniref:Insulinase family protein n=1 Tax=Glacieibacterium frigidum TaxID=2593303 RepID=A0A552U7W0_9SPHN|nr:pitrilysin family protein [Glacieibacterium frigidum]TRW14259.1 insulinase family protein [Glacieibacterium frigidum]
MRNLLALLLALLLIGAAPAPTADLVRQVDIAHDSFTLDNGLRVIVHTDRKTPVVAVSVWYHIGSKDEPAGKTGFAHLFEHLMYYGSENNNDVFFKKLEEVGATDANGTTYFDRTNYFENVPTPALELALFLESDRMGHLLGAVDQKKLDAQRGVVQNEKRQGDNEPYGLVNYALLEGLFPPGHPYRHDTIGSMADLDAASLDDVKNWFRANYGPNNAVLVLAGDIDVATARPLVAKYFGDILRGPEPRRFAAPVPKRTATTRETMRDAVANPRLIRAYVLPGRADPAVPLVDVAATVLAGGQTSRLYDALVRKERLAVGVSGGVNALEKVSWAQFNIDVAPGVDPAKVEARVDQLFAQFLKTGPTADEVQRVATRAVAGTIRGLESVGGFGGKAVSLAEGAVYMNDPGYYKIELARYADATPASVAAAARTWLARGDHRIVVLPGTRTARDIAKAVEGKADAPVGVTAPPVRAASTQPGVDRSKLPTVAGLPDLVFPPVERTTLSNGMRVTLARRTTIPVVRVLLSFDAGLAADDRAKPGTTSLMLGLLDEGAGKRTGVEIAAAKERLGAGIGTPAGLDRTRVTLDALKPNLAASLDLFADIVRRPTFPAAELERVRGQALAGIAQELSDPGGIARRTLPALLWGPTHPYASLGSGTPEGVKAVTRADLVAAHARTIRPDTGEIFVVGDTTMAELRPLLEARFGDWRAPTVPPVSKTFPTVAPPAAGRIILIDRPGAPQSLIRGGVVLPVKGTDDLLALRIGNDIVGGLSTSRLNTDLRETKAWAYGVGSSIGDAREQVSFQVVAPVQTDRTGDSIAAIRDILAKAKGDRKIDAAEVKAATENSIRTLPGDFEGGDTLLSALERNALLGRPDDFYTTLSGRYRKLGARDINAAAAAAVQPDRIIWVVVGDRKLVEPQLRKLGLPVEVR